MVGLLEFAPCTCGEPAAALAPVALPEVEPFHPALDHVRDLGADHDAEDAADGSWEDASAWTTSEDDADPDDRWTTSLPEVAPAALLPPKPKRSRKPKAPATIPTGPTPEAQIATAAAPLAHQLAARIGLLRSEHTPLATLMADHLGRLLAEVEATDAPDVATFLDRRSALLA